MNKTDKWDKVTDAEGRVWKRREVTSGLEARALMGIDPVTKEPARRFYPFAIGLPVRGSDLIGFERNDVFFIYAQTSGLAMTKAKQLWSQWVKRDKGLTDKDFPKVCANQLMPLSLRLDDSDFDSLWKEVRVVNMNSNDNYYEGDYNCPVAFLALNADAHTFF